MKALSRMPSPSDTKAPRFDPAQPRSLQHFFEELDFWFEDIGITSDTQKKRYARRYTDFSTAELWQALPEYASTPSPSPSLYSDFVSAIIALYPEADPRTRYSFTDLAVIVSRQVRLATQTCAHIGEYYRSFYPVAASLVAQGGLAKVKRDELFLIGFGPSFSCCVKWKLEITMGLSPHGSYSIENAYHVALAVAHSLEALELISAARARASASSHSSPFPSPSPPLPPSPSDKCTSAEPSRKTLVSGLPHAISPVISLASAKTFFSALGASQEVEKSISAEKSAVPAGDHQSVFVSSIPASSPRFPPLRTQILGLVAPNSVQQQFEQSPIPSQLRPALAPSGHAHTSSLPSPAPSPRLSALKKSSKAPKVAQQLSVRVAQPFLPQTVPLFVKTFNNSPPTSSYLPFSPRTPENAPEASKPSRASHYISASPVPPEMSQTQPEDLLDGWNKISNSQPHVLAQGRAPEASKPPRASPRTSAPQPLLRTPPASLEGCIRSIAQSHSRPSPLPNPENAQNASNTLSALPQHLQDIVNAVVTALPPPSLPRQPDTLSPSSCHFCSRAGHHLKSCMVVHMYLAQGKVRHNADGYIVLRSGSFIPRHLPGTCIRDRVDFLYCMRSPLTIAPTAAV